MHAATKCVLTLLASVTMAQTTSWVDGRMGAQLTKLDARLPAAAAGLREGDILVRIAGVSIDSGESYAAAMKAASEAPRLTVSYQRPDGQGGIVSGEATLQRPRPEIDWWDNARVGFLVERVAAGSLAERSELQPGDVIFQINDKVVHSPAVLDIVQSSYDTDQRVLIHFHRYWLKASKWASAISRRKFQK